MQGTAKNKNGNLSLEKTGARGWSVLMDSRKGDAENPFFKVGKQPQTVSPVFDLLKNRTYYE
tara:strand:- start:491 stop:676 length:186 start_codon:yes stop_codon:yes gene_type:complete